MKCFAKSQVELNHPRKKVDAVTETPHLKNVNLFVGKIYLAKTVDQTNAVAFEIAQSILKGMANPFMEHFNCIQSYLKLWQTDPAHAAQLGKEADQLLNPTKSGHP